MQQIAFDRIKLFATILIVAMPFFISAQQSYRYTCYDGNISFFSSTPLKDVSAVNKEVKSILDIKSKTLAFVVTMKAFDFKNSLMQEHFNEKYVESDTYPQATFTGRITSDFNPSEYSEQSVTVEGKLTIHGVSHSIIANGTLHPQKDQIDGQATFIVKPADFNIKIPKLLIKNIAEEVEVNTEVTYLPKKNNAP
ncbi:MAG: YceI family protein [Marinilabiliaceae bacterium]|nr:YceI family protein [Marinilabiliaceae bacterium]